MKNNEGLAKQVHKEEKESLRSVEKK